MDGRDVGQEQLPLQPQLLRLVHHVPAAGDADHAASAAARAEFSSNALTVPYW